MRPIYLNFFDTPFFGEFNRLLFDTLEREGYDYHIISGPSDIDLSRDAAYLFYPCLGASINGVNVMNGLTFDVSAALLEQCQSGGKRAGIYIFFSERIMEKDGRVAAPAMTRNYWEKIERLRHDIDGMFFFSRYYSDLMVRHGFPSEFLPIGYSQEYGDWDGSITPCDRAIDVLHLGTISRGDRREYYLKNIVSQGIPLRMANNLWGPERNEILRRTKICLNLHYDVSGEFEWDRLLLALHNGCLVVSENITDPYPLEPGKHFIDSRAEDLAQVLKETLNNYEVIYTEIQANLAELKSNYSFAETFKKMIAKVAGD